MKLSKVLSLVAVFAVLVTFSACADMAKVETDIKANIDTLVKAIDSATTKINASADADSAVAAINECSDAFKKFMKDMAELDKKYPFATKDQTDKIMEKLEPEKQKIMESSTKFGEAIGTAMTKFGTDATALQKIQDAVKNFQNATVGQ